MLLSNYPSRVKERILNLGNLSLAHELKKFDYLPLTDPKGLRCAVLSLLKRNHIKRLDQRSHASYSFV